MHDGAIMENLFEPIVQFLGHAIYVNGIVRRMVREELAQSVMSALDTIQAKSESGCMVG